MMRRREHDVRSRGMGNGDENVQRDTMRRLREMMARAYRAQASKQAKGELWQLAENKGHYCSCFIGR